MQEFSSKDFSSTDLDILSRAYYRALDRIKGSARNMEVMKSVLLDAIVAAARGGQRDERLLEARALAAVWRRSDSTAL
jgi:hypothetical protein